MGKSQNASERLQSAVADWRIIGAPRFTAFGLNFLSLSAFTLGRYGEARAALKESIALNRSVGDRWGLGTAYRGLGLVAQAQGEHPQALVAFHKSQDILTDLGARWDLARVLAEMGRSLFALGNDIEAEHFWLESLRISIETQATLVGLEAVVGIASLQAKRGKNEEALESLLMILNHPASIQETKNRASQLHAQLVARLTPQENEVAQQRAGARTLTLLAAELLGQTGNI